MGNEEMDFGLCICGWARKLIRIGKIIVKIIGKGVRKDLQCSLKPPLVRPINRKPYKYDKSQILN